VLAEQVQVLGDAVEDLLVPEPAGRLAVDLQRRRLEDEHVTAIFESSHVGVERLPVVAYQRQPTGGGELSWDALAVQDRRGRVPAQGLGSFGLAEGLEQADAAAVGVQAIDIVEYQGLVAVLVGLEVDAQRGGLAAEPADLAAQRLADAAALADAGRAEEQQEVQVPSGEGPDILLQGSIGRHTDGVPGQPVRRCHGRDSWDGGRGPCPGEGLEAPWLRRRVQLGLG
jgi:hypothetical protein